MKKNTIKYLFEGIIEFRTRDSMLALEISIEFVNE